MKFLRPTHPAVSTNMARRFGWASRGERCRMSVPFGHWKTKTLVAALRWDRIDAPLTIDGALDGASFLAYVEQVLAPMLSAGETVLMDNVRTHKVAGIQEAIQAKGASVVYLPPYSPDFNPIEKPFSKIKSILERIAARTVDALEVAVGEQLPTAIFGAPIGGEAPDFRAPLPGSPISESMCAWIALTCLNRQGNLE